MAKLIYAAITSLDGYIADERGKFDWAAPDDEVHAFVNDLQRPIGTYLYGRRMYDVMVAWDNPEIATGQPAVIGDFAQMWRTADKVVYSHTLQTASSARTRIERAFDPETVRAMKRSAPRDLGIGGAELAAEAIGAGLVDEYHLFLTPIIVGGGRHWLPENVRVPLALVDERRFESGVVHVHYRNPT